MQAVEIHIRRADVRDAEVVRDLAERTFRATYAPYNPPNLMEEYVAEAFTLDKMREELRGAHEFFFVATAGDAACGYAKLRGGDAPETVAADRPVELERIYVETAYHGTGVGRELLEVALAHARDSGYDVVWLGVWGRNKRAVAFYRRKGFVVVGTKVFQFGSDAQTDLLMAKTIAG